MALLISGRHIIALCFYLSPFSAWALDCSPPNFTSDMANATLIAVGEVASIEPIQSGTGVGPVFSVAIREVWKGDVGLSTHSITVSSVIWSYPQPERFPVGTQIVLAVSSNRDGTYQAPMCAEAFRQIKTNARSETYVVGSFTQNSDGMLEEIPLDALRHWVLIPATHRPPTPDGPRAIKPEANP